MQLKKSLADHELITLIALASKVCSEIIVLESDEQQALKQKQLDLLSSQVSKILARIDKELPGIIPVPTDGVPWNRRL